MSAQAIDRPIIETGTGRPVRSRSAGVMEQVSLTAAASSLAQAWAILPLHGVRAGAPGGAEALDKIAGPDSDIDALYTLLPGRRLGGEIEQLADELSELLATGSTWCHCAPCTRCCGRQSWPKPGPSMQRDILLLIEMVDAAEQAGQLTAGITVSQLETDRQRRDALLWNFTVLGEAAAQLSAELKDRFPDITWQQPMRLRNRIVHGYWSIDLEILHTTATEQLPAFVASLRSVLSTLTDGA